MPEKIIPANPKLFERWSLPLLIVLIFVILSVTAFYICYRHHTINTEQTLQKDRSEAAILSLLLEERLKKTVSAMESYSNRPQLLRAVQDKNVEKASVHLVSLTKYYPDIDSLIITDRQGTLWTAHPERMEVLGMSFAYRDWYKDVSKEWKSNISDVILRVVGEKDIAIQISVPIFDETGQAIGILLNTQRTVGLSLLTKHMPLDPDTFITITDRKGQIAYDSKQNVEKEIRPYPFHPNIKKAMAENNKTFAVDDPVSGGRTHYISFAPVGNIGWTVFIERDKRSILLSESAYFVQVTAIAFLLFIFITLFIFYSRKQVRSTNEFKDELLRILNITPFPIAIVDAADNNIYFWSQSALAIFGHTASTAKDWFQMAYPDPDYQREVTVRWNASLEKARLSDQSVYAGEYSITCRDGSVCVCDLYVAFLADRLIVTFNNITERKEIEAGLEKTRKELAVIKIAADEASEFAENVINTVREPLISLDQNLRVVTVSRSFYDFFKVKPEDTVGQLIYDLGNKQWNIPKLRELLETILPEKASFDNYEVEHDFTGVGRRIMLLNARQIERASGKERIILLAIEDITERKEIEAGLEKAHGELLELAVELRHTARVKSEFLANMSHELRTPLNSINGFSEVLFDETFGPLNEKQKKYVNNVLTSGKHLLLLINQILDMAKVEAGKMNLTLSSLTMKSLLNEISLLLADMVSKKKIEMLIEIAEDLPEIEADDLKVKQIIYNLLSNAVKFTPEGGKIGMRAKKTDSEIEVVVWDTGIGIAPENMAKIFEGFFRVDTPYSRVTEGTGLGLPLSKKLVELHNGKLSVESEGLNKGASVRFTLPIISMREV